MPITPTSAKAALSKFSCSITLGVPTPNDMVSIETIVSTESPSLISFYERGALDQLLKEKTTCPETRQELNVVSKTPSKNLFALVLAMLHRKNLSMVIESERDEDDSLRAILDQPDESFLTLMKNGEDLLDAIIAASGNSIEEKLRSIETVLKAYQISVTPAIINFLTKTLGFDMADIKEFSEPKQQREAANITNPTKATTTVTAPAAAPGPGPGPGSTFPLPAFSQSKTEAKAAVEAKITKEMEQFRLQNYLEEIRESAGKASVDTSFYKITDWATYKEYGYADMWQIDEAYFDTHREKVLNFLLFYRKENDFAAMLAEKRDILFQSIKKLHENPSKSPLSSVVQENNKLVKQFEELSNPSALRAFVQSSETDPARFFASQMPADRASSSSSSSSSPYRKSQS